MQAPAILEPSTAPRANAPTQHYQLSDGEDEDEYDDDGNKVPRTHGKRRHRTGGWASASSTSYAAALPAASSGSGGVGAVVLYGQMQSAGHGGGGYAPAAVPGVASDGMGYARAVAAAPGSFLSMGSPFVPVQQHIPPGFMPVGGSEHTFPLVSNTFRVCSSRSVNVPLLHGRFRLRLLLPSGRGSVLVRAATTVIRSP